MVRTTTLGSIYLLLLFAFAAGIKSLADNDCSDWLLSCPGAQSASLDMPDEARRPDEPELH